MAQDPRRSDPDPGRIIPVAAQNATLLDHSFRDQERRVWRGRPKDLAVPLGADHGPGEQLCEKMR